MTALEDLESPGVLIESALLEKNLRSMQAACDAHGVELWPHIKTHKLVPILRRQLELGARGATCAKLGEAEAMLPSGVRRIFIAHSLADLSKAARLRKLHGRVDKLILAVTSETHCDILEKLLEAADISVSILMAVDTGLGREGTRTPQQSLALANRIRASARMNLIGLYTHEGHAYGAANPAEVSRVADVVHARLIEHADAAGDNLSLWPGCSVTAKLMAAKPRVCAVRPGSYVFGDLSLSDGTQVTRFADNALTVVTTVVDRPAPGLALIDAGSKVFSSDKSSAGLHGRCLDAPSITIQRLNEEHGYLSGDGVDKLVPGDRLRFVPAHVCPVVNLASHVHLLNKKRIIASWSVNARGRSD